MQRREFLKQLDREALKLEHQVQQDLVFPFASRTLDLKLFSRQRCQEHLEALSFWCRANQPEHYLLPDEFQWLRENGLLPWPPTQPETRL